MADIAALIQEHLDTAGVTLDETVVDRIADASIAEAERRLGWRPFLEETGERLLPGPTRSVYDMGALTVLSLTELRVGVEYDGTGGTVLAEGVDFLLSPLGEVRFTEIVFLTGLMPGLVKLTGDFGRYTDWPVDLAEAIALRGTALALKEVAAGTAGDLRRIDQGAVKIEYGTEAGRGTIDRYEAEFTAAIRRYARVM
jgi:hypothetical protein